MWKIHLACGEAHVNMQHVWKTWQEENPSLSRNPENVCITWPCGHVTTHASWLQVRCTPTLSRLKWKTTAAANVFPPQLFRSLSFLLFPSPPLLFLLACVSIFHRPIPTSLPLEPFIWMEILRREGKKCCSWNMCQLAK